ncbi:MAG: TonB-dependent receptor [Prevotella sp.]|nr:TonB-dependent receptor [Prevotella sp.]
MMMVPVMVSAQERQNLRQIYEKAEEAYQIGLLDQAIELLEGNLNNFSGNLRQSALRLVSICYLAQDDKESSEKYASLLLSINPYYTSVQDPIRFEDMIALLKSGRSSTVTTASSQAESINEAPVPVTVITREMIDQISNNKSIGQILATYVPGLNEVSAYSISNVAMHGVYTSSQEKILVMENGHRLNMRATNNGKLDYAISTEKIDHIEILRGPASSLYGNVALTAVVNIITKDGREINGVKGKYGYGSYGTHRADFIAGTTLLDADVMAWASIYTSQGEKVDIPKYSDYSMTKHDGYVYIGGYEGKPSYDIGFNIKLKDFNFMVNLKNGKQVPQYSWYGETYNYDVFRTLDGNKPGYTINEKHAELGYTKQLGKLNLNVSAYGDWFKVQDYMPVSNDPLNLPVFDSNADFVRNEDGSILMRNYSGVLQNLTFQEYTIGTMAKADANYTLGNMKGNLLLGAQFEYFKLSSNDYLMGEDYIKVFVTYPESKGMLSVSSERSISAFVQGKHYFTPQFILNAGLRFDNKNRASGKNVTAFSPRVALIYLPSEKFSTKLSFSRAFVDAPYFYRHNTSNGARGSEDLMPEYMSAFQLDFMGKINKWHIGYDVNIFYNNLTDIVVNNPSTDPSTPKYINSGSLKVAGTEAELNFTLPSFRVDANMTYLHPLEAEGYYYTDHKIYSIPSFTANLVCSKRLVNAGHHLLWLSAGFMFGAKTLNKANTRLPDSKDYELSGNAIVDLGLKYTYHDAIHLSLDCDNLFDKTYYVGGSFYVPYRASGRTVMATVSFKL